MHTWWTGLAEAPPDEAQALHALGLGFMAARTLHVALELRLFTHLATEAQTLTPVAPGYRYMPRPRALASSSSALSKSCRRGKWTTERIFPQGISTYTMCSSR